MNHYCVITVTIHSVHFVVVKHKKHFFRLAVPVRVVGPLERRVPAIMQLSVTVGGHVTGGWFPLIHGL